MQLVWSIKTTSSTKCYCFETHGEKQNGKGRDPKMTGNFGKEFLTLQTERFSINTDDQPMMEFSLWLIKIFASISLKSTSASSRKKPTMFTRIFTVTKSMHLFTILKSIKKAHICSSFISQESEGKIPGK